MKNETRKFHGWILAMFAAGSVYAADSTSTATATVAPMSGLEKAKGNVILKVFGEWFYDFTDGVSKTSGFDITRAYIGYKQEFNANLSGNVTVDMGRENAIVSDVYDTATKSVATKTDNRYNAFLKTAALKWQQLLPMTTVEAGLVGTNLFSTQENFWGYRYVYKSFLDQNEFGPAADLGAKVTVRPLEMVGINAEVLNGEGFKNPQDVYGDYKFSLSADLKLPMGICAYAYYDYLPFHGLEAQSNIAGFAGYEMKGRFRVGAEYDYQISNKGILDKDLNGISGFAAYNLLENLEAFGRFDLLQSKNDWNTATDGQAIVAGLHYSPVKGVKVAADYQGFTPAVSGAKVQPKVKLNLEYSL